MLVEDLRAAGHEVVTFGFGRWAEGEPPAVKVWHQAIDLVRYPALLLRTRPDLVHLNTSLDRRALCRDVPFALVTRLLGRRVLVKWHGSEPELLSSRSPLWRALSEALLRLVSGVAVLSSEEAAAVRGRRRAPRCDVVRNGLDLGRYVNRRPVRERLGVPAESPLLLFIGRLIPAKGLLDVVRALPELAGRYGAHLVVVGEGPTRAAAGALARELHIESRVHFTGRLPEEEAADYYCGCDVLVFPTYHPEGFPMTVFQSMAAGLGIVTTRQRAAADYLREPENCLFVPPRDPVKLAAALGRLLGDAALLERMRGANREDARRFDRRVVAAEFGDLYAGLLAGPASSRKPGGPTLSPEGA
jgi:glycosyltransferase involved in cell wall biosynthesis